MINMRYRLALGGISKPLRAHRSCCPNNEKTSVIIMASWGDSHDGRLVPDTTAPGVAWLHAVQAHMPIIVCHGL